MSLRKIRTEATPTGQASSFKPLALGVSIGNNSITLTNESPPKGRNTCRLLLSFSNSAIKSHAVETGKGSMKERAYETEREHHWEAGALSSWVICSEAILSLGSGNNGQCPLAKSQGASQGWSRLHLLDAPALPRDGMKIPQVLVHSFVP